MMDYFRMFFVFSFIILLFASCGVNKKPTPEDQRRKELLLSTFGDRYRFKFEADLYLIAENLLEPQPSRDDAEKIYKLFWFTENNQIRSDTNYVYLNVYNNKGVFQFQVYWSPQREGLEYSRTEHY